MSRLARSVGSGAVTVLSKFFEETPELTALRRKIASIMTKDRLTQVGLDLLNNQAGAASSRPATPTEAMLKTALSLGMSVTLAGGVEKVKGLSIQEIISRALAVRRLGAARSAATRQQRAEHMRICDKGDPRGAMLYALGQGNLLWLGWDLGSDADRDGWREEIKQRASDARARSAASRQERAEHMRICDKGDPKGARLYALGQGNHLWLGWDLGSDDDRAGWQELIKQRASDNNARGTSSAHLASIESRSAGAKSRYTVMY